jgi:hypothetical protein
VSAAAEERRANARHRFAIQGSNPPIATLGLLPRAALICDLGSSGIGLLTTLAPPLGAIVPVWLPGPPGSPSSLVLGTIVHTSLMTEGLYRVGLTCREESAGVLVALLDQWHNLGWTVA